ncbi:hypothetical protein BOTCAL_0393g00030 [Botryotinia calthae]|uniref:Uncharacterized protein n=1 Tax=Botryotinia calthae TaxID=38488 RepID=A0A4Y8CQL8_9HELO|nr:hypothetical protein BOTCAL_0393g00030 [Botryotinia calthae]
MPIKPFFPFNQDHPTFPAEMRSCQKNFSSREAARGATPILQDYRMNHREIFEKGCRKAFSGFFRHGSKDFCLVENMNPDLLPDFFFEIRHSTNPSEYADITAATRGIRNSTKFFFVSCNYHDPEHVIVRTYAKLWNFDWDNQSQIDDLNLFRMAAITEGCGIIAFTEDGKILLPPPETKSTIEVTPEEQSSKKRKEFNVVESSFDDLQNDTRVSNSSEAQSNVTVQILQAHPLAPPFQPTTFMSQVDDWLSFAYSGSPVRGGVWGALGVGQGLQSLVQPGGHVSQPPTQVYRSHETLHQFNQRHVVNQGQDPGYGMQQQGPWYNQRSPSQFTSQVYGMYQQHGQGQQNLTQISLDDPHAPSRYVPHQHAQQRSVQIQTERYRGPQQAQQGDRHFVNLSSADFQQYEQDSDNDQD